MVEIREAAANPGGDGNPFPSVARLKIDVSVGIVSWGWPNFPCGKQQLVYMEKFDPGRDLAHMPLMVFFGTNFDGIKSVEAVAGSEERAKLRGWGKLARVKKGFAGDKDWWVARPWGASVNALNLDTPRSLPPGVGVAKPA